MTRPLPNSYWATPLLLASEYPGARTAAEAATRLDALLDAGLHDFYDLTEATEPLAPYEALLMQRAAAAGLPPNALRYRRFAIRDAGLPDAATLAAVLKALDESADAGRPAVVHCWGGIGRTGTVVGCHLQQRQGLSGAQALAHIAHEWQWVEKADRVPRSPETDAQVAFVREFAQGSQR